VVVLVSVLSVSLWVVFEADVLLAVESVEVVSVVEDNV
jgi:hypothetical protein